MFSPATALGLAAKLQFMVFQKFVSEKTEMNYWFIIHDIKEISEEDILELAIESGANECKSYKEFHEIQCSINDIYNVKKELEKKIINFISTGIEWVPLNVVEISEEKKKELISFFETLENDDDVQNIYSNVKFST